MMAETQGSKTVSTKLERIAKLAKERPNVALTTLAHHIDVEWLREAHRRTRKDGAPGIDGQGADEYAEHLEDNLRSLLERAKDGRYRAPPVRRVHIPKGDGSQTRPIGIPTFEDKVLQRAVTMVLEGNSLEYPDEGTPQGGVISPLLANIYLHEVVDEWFARDVRPRLQGYWAKSRKGNDVVKRKTAKDRFRRAYAASTSGVGSTGTSPWPSSTQH